MKPLYLLALYRSISRSAWFLLIFSDNAESVFSNEAGEEGSDLQSQNDTILAVVDGGEAQA